MCLDRSEDPLRMPFSGSCRPREAIERTHIPRSIYTVTSYSQDACESTMRIFAADRNKGLVLYSISIVHAFRTFSHHVHYRPTAADSLIV